MTEFSRRSRYNSQNNEDRSRVYGENCKYLSCKHYGQRDHERLYFYHFIGGNSSETDSLVEQLRDLKERKIY